MSIAAMNWAFGVKSVSPTEKLVLLCLADHANDDGLCWPGQGRIADKSGLTDRTVKRALKSLEESEVITTRRRTDVSGRQITNQYVLELKKQEFTTSVIGECQAVTPEGDSVSPKPSEEPSFIEEANASLSDAALLAYQDMAEDLKLPKVAKLTRQRRALLTARLEDCRQLAGAGETPLDVWNRALAKIRGDPFFHGAGKTGWVANFDFLMRQSKFIKLMEGGYDTKKSNCGKGRDTDRRRAGIATAVARRMEAVTRTTGADGGNRPMDSPPGAHLPADDAGAGSGASGEDAGAIRVTG